MNDKPKKSVLITDLDNTLFDWFDIWRSTFIPMLNRTVEISGIPREQLIKEIKLIHQKHGTAEYAFVLQEVPSLLSMYGTPHNIMEKLNDAIHAARSNRLQHLKLYQGVYDTLSELRARRIKVIAYTESKQWYTKYRLKRFGLDHFIDHVYSPQDHEIIPIRDGERTEFNFDHTKFSHTAPGELKPNPKLLLHIIKEQNLNKDECVYIGDSEFKDVNMAIAAGVTSVYAKYGTGHFSDERQKDYDVLREVTHWSDEEVAAERKLKESVEEHYKADYSIDNFSELLNIINFVKSDLTL
ncbi:HAD-IA family hydrolase [Vibrio cholerae]|uniref:HAD family hydrolase n=1 Tax=Vibrio cholerae TaxID=666 RepID=UPI003967DA8B